MKYEIFKQILKRLGLFNLTVLQSSSLPKNLVFSTYVGTILGSTKLHSTAQLQNKPSLVTSTKQPTHQSQTPPKTNRHSQYKEEKNSHSCPAATPKIPPYTQPSPSALCQLHFPHSAPSFPTRVPSNPKPSGTTPSSLYSALPPYQAPSLNTVQHYRYLVSPSPLPTHRESSITIRRWGVLCGDLTLGRFALVFGGGREIE